MGEASDVEEFCQRGAGEIHQNMAVAVRLRRSVFIYYLSQSRGHYTHSTQYTQCKNLKKKT